MTRPQVSEPYRRFEWLEIVFGKNPYEQLLDYKIPLWISDEQAFLFDAVNLWGAANLPNWTGEEIISLQYPKDAIIDPPHTWKPSVPFIITEEGEIQYVPESEVSKWWNGILPILEKEYNETIQSCERWERAVNSLRSELAGGKRKAFVRNEKDGELILIKEKYWRSSSANIAFSNQYAETTVYAAMIDPIKYKGYAIVECADLRNMPRGNYLLPDPDQFPYVDFLIQGANSIDFTLGKRIPKKGVEEWVNNNWPKSFGEKTTAKVFYLSTFLRRPEDEKGGNHKEK